METQACPQCGHQKLSDDNPFGMWVCAKCGWGRLKEQSVLSVKDYLRTFGKWISLGAMVCSLAVLSVQLYVWKEYAFEVTLIQWKRFSGGMLEKDWVQMGAICNSLEKPQCSVSMFKKVVDNSPHHKQALGNIAINQAKLGLWNPSQSYFKAYFAAGGSAFDVMHWYARALEREGNRDQSLEWYYHAVAANTQSYLAALDLYERLRQRRRNYEALSLAASVTHGDPWAQGKWPELPNDIGWAAQSLQADSWEVEGGARRIELPSFSGHYHYAPVKLTPKGRTRFFAVEPGVKITVINESWYHENQLSAPEGNEPKSVKTLNGEQNCRQAEVYLQIGPWNLEKQQAYICPDVQSVIGESTLRSFQTKSWHRFNTSFLRLEK